MEITHICVAKTRLPRSATEGVCCVVCLIVTHATRPEPASPTWVINRTHAIENPASADVQLPAVCRDEFCCRSPRACRHSEMQTPLIELEAGIRVRLGGLQWLCRAISECHALIKIIQMCVAETRQPGSATARVLCVGCLIATHAAGTSRTKQVNKNREFRLTSSCLALPRACLSP